MFFRISLILLIVLFTVTSCSIEKRIYRKGYHAVWNNKHSHETKKQEDQKIAKLKQVNEPLPEEVVVSSNRESDIISLKRRPLLILNKDTCGDKLLLQNADELSVKILEIDEKNIKYKRCDNINGPTYSISKSRVALITYANGTKEVVMPEAPIKQPERVDSQKPEMPRKVNPTGLTSLLLYILGAILSRGLTAATLSGSMLILILILSVAPLILAYVSLFQFKREPERYTGRWMPITVVCLYLAGLLLFALVFAALGAYLGGGAGPFVAICLLLFLLFLGILIAALIPIAKPPTNAK